MKKLVIALLSFLLIIIGIFLIIFFVETSPVSRNEEVLDFEVTSGSTYLTIADELKQDNLIRSVFFYKLYIKLMNPKPIQAGKYGLSESMSVTNIINTLSLGSNYNPDAVKFTIPEGKTLTEIASIISDATNYTSDELLEVWNSSSFVNEVIENYWFVTDAVKEEGIAYSLEGYLFPDTYEILNKDVDIKSIAYKMLDRMDEVLLGYKDEIESSDYTIHELLTLASMAEEEGITASDRALITGVFYNRLNLGMALGSDVTSYYGYQVKLGHELSKEEKTDALYDENLYNTRNYVTALPVGPICSPSASSIEAAINPTENDYLYFIANTCDDNDSKTYFAETYEEHLALVAEYLTCE
ncbi:MAG: endolytic transglycosylase MltG [Bacilli bacterium]|nr:endolytic transglycosylase MltG [Bacilli bacterium]